MASQAELKDIGTALESRSSERAFRDYRRSVGDAEAEKALDQWLGDVPEPARIRRAAAALDRPEADLKRMAESDDQASRRLGRLVLLDRGAGSDDAALLQKGLSDPVARIRCDAARFVSVGDDRTRLYNQLIRLIREDPDVHVRSSAGRRLAGSFDDLYSMDFEGLPPLSRMLLLDALEGVTRSDEERAEVLLNASDGEAAFRAARCLMKWGTLARYFRSGGSESAAVLERCAALGVVDYLEGADVDQARRESAVRLAGLAGRDDLVRRFTGSASPNQDELHEPIRTVEELEALVDRLAALDGDERENALGELPLDETGFRTALERAFPPPERDRSTTVLFDIARAGRWTSWAGRIGKALNHEDPDIRRAAAEALPSIDPESAESALPPLLTDPVDRVRRRAAHGLASLASGGGCPALAEYLSLETDEKERSAVLDGVRRSGGAAIARCITDNAGVMPPESVGALLAEGIDSVGVELLVDGFSSAADLKKALQSAGPPAGESMVAAWSAVDSSARRRLLSWIGASGWADGLPALFDARGRREFDRIRSLLEPMDAEARGTLLQTAAEKSSGRSRRYMKRLMRA